MRNIKLGPHRVLDNHGPGGHGDYVAIPVLVLRGD